MKITVLSNLYAGINAAVFSELYKFLMFLICLTELAFVVKIFHMNIHFLNKFDAPDSIMMPITIIFPHLNFNRLMLLLYNMHVCAHHL